MLKDHEERKSSSGEGVYGRDRRTFSECIETALQTRGLSEADWKNSENPRKGSNGYLHFTNLRESKTNVHER